MIQAHLHGVFSQWFSSNVHLLNDSIYIFKLLQLDIIFKQKSNHEVPSHQNFCLKFFTTPSSKNIIATLRIVTIEKHELTFLILYFHALTQVFSCEICEISKNTYFENICERLLLQQKVQGSSNKSVI